MLRVLKNTGLSSTEYIILAGVWHSSLIELKDQSEQGMWIF